MHVFNNYSFCPDAIYILDTTFPAKREQAIVRSLELANLPVPNEYQSRNSYKSLATPLLQQFTLAYT